jgi:hypothetical protein
MPSYRLIDRFSTPAIRASAVRLNIAADPALSIYQIIVLRLRWDAEKLVALVAATTHRFGCFAIQLAEIIVSPKATTSREKRRH